MEQDYSADYINEAIDVEIGTLGLPAHGAMGLKELSDDTSVICIAERIISVDCNDGIDNDRLGDLLAAMLPDGGSLYAWLYTYDDYRKSLLEKLDILNIAGFSPFDVRTVTNDKRKWHIIKPIREIIPGVNKKQLMNDLPGILAFKLSGNQLRQIGLPYTVLTFAGWKDDRMGIMLRDTGKNDLLTSFPSYADLTDSYDIVIFPAGEHGSDCIIASKSLSKNELKEMICAAMDKLGWRWAFRGHIEGDGYEQMYRRSMAEERHPGHSRIDLNLE